LKSVAFGTRATAINTNSYAMGTNAFSMSPNSYAYGSNSFAQGANSTAFGANSTALSVNASAFGSNSYADAYNAMAKGTYARAIGPNADAKGAGSQAYNTNSMAYGSGSLASGWQATAFGAGATAFDTSSLAVGPYASATAPYSSAFGAGAVAKAAGATAIGAGALADRAYQMTFGTKASSYKMPGLSRNGFVGSRYQNQGNKRIVTTDNEGTLGTTDYSITKLENSIGAVGALSAALGAMPTQTLSPNETLRCGVGGAGYAGQYAGALGCVAKVGNRVYVNGGISGTPTQTVNNGDVMGRIGFTFGFGGNVLKQLPAEVASVQSMSSAETMFSVGSGASAAPAQGELLMAKSTSVDASTTQLIDQKADSEDVEALRERLAELEAEITTLRDGAVESDDSELKMAYNHAMTTIDELIAEKQEVEEALMARIEQQDQRIANLEAIVKQLMAKADQ